MQDNLLFLIHRAVKVLHRDPAKAKEFIPALALARKELHQVFVRYENPAPDGGEEIREALLEATYLYCLACDRLLKALHKPAGADLVDILETADTASELLDEAEEMLEDGEA